MVKVLACKPAPAEVLVHIDAGDDETAGMLDGEFGDAVRWTQSESRQGPGGGRNKLIREAKEPFVACFDDDSWPMHEDYFALAEELLKRQPSAAVITGAITLPTEGPAHRYQFGAGEVNCFVGCACVLRREAFLATQGYLPLRYAYGMEESDVALQLLDLEWRLLQNPALRVYHAVAVDHWEDPKICSAHIANTALLAFLRYPITAWPLGAGQVANQVMYAIREGRYQGALLGVLDIPGTLLRYSDIRRPIQRSTLMLSRQLRWKSR